MEGSAAGPSPEAQEEALFHLQRIALRVDGEEGGEGLSPKERKASGTERRPAHRRPSGEL